MRMVLNSAATPAVPDIDIVIAGGKINAGVMANCSIVATIVVLERAITDGRVRAAGCVEKERIDRLTS